MKAKKISLYLFLSLLMLLSCACKNESSGTTINKPTDTDSIVTCENCDAKNSSDAKFCGECGEKMVKKDSTTVCMNCDSENPADAKFCEECGEKMAKKDSTAVCMNCDAENPADAKFCEECGETLGKKENTAVCMNCDTENPADAEFCEECGADLSDEYDTADDPESGTSECSICAYEGLDECEGHECISCEGEGYIKCYGCVNGDTAYGPCPVCTDGKIDCTCENGTVYYDRDIYIPSTEETTECTKCEKGFVECSLCEGTGKYGSYSAGGFDGSDFVEIEETCSRCRGRKKTECTYCGGDGMV